MKTNWVCFCSQTGSEITNICRIIGKEPNMIVTNNYKRLTPATLEFIKKNAIILCIVPFNPSNEHLALLNIPDHSLITLHGWLRILPKEFCETYKRLYNGHPGLINHFPELKGKDPQERAFKGGYNLIGSVVHKVTPEVDEGEILTYDEASIYSTSLDDYYNILKETSLNAWEEFLNEQL